MGIKQALELKDKLKDIQFDLIFCSPLDRAIDKCLVYDDIEEEEEFDVIIKKNKTTINGETFDTVSSERSIKVDETNNYDENKKKDDVDNVNITDFTNNSEKKVI